MLALGAGCTAPPLQPAYRLANDGKPLSNPQGVCVQIGLTDSTGKKAGCYQLAQAPADEHVEPLPLDEFGYLFPPLKPEPALAPATVPSPATLGAAALAQPVPTIAEATPLAPVAAPEPVAARVATSTSRYTTRIVHFSTQVPFRLNRAQLVRANRDALTAFVNSLEQYHGIESIRITGHTDRSGPTRFNNWLSLMRAKSVQLRLLSMGADPHSMQIRGVGSTEPRARTQHAADNRYVDIEVVVRVPVN